MDNIYCEVCKIKFQKLQYLKEHQIKKHGREKSGFNCAQCNSIVYKGSYEQHLLNSHSIRIEHENLVVGNEAEFNEWKLDMERKTKSYYVCKRNLIVRGNRKKYFVCNRSGSYCSKSQKRRSRKQGSRKIGAKCPASIIATHTPRNIKIVFTKTHVGHLDHELKHLNQLQVDREKIAADLNMGLSATTILQKIRMSQLDEETNRMDLITRQDVKNIKRSFGININTDVLRHANDLVYIESWIEEMERSSDNPVLLYSPPDEDGENFMLAICSSFQSNLCKQNGANIIVVDSTHLTNHYNFQLTSIIIVDENEVVFPIAFLYSTTVDTTTCCIFFNAVKEKCGEICPNTFMSDDFNAYYDAWEQVFGACENRVLCTWHVLRSWETHLSKVVPLLRKQMHADLLELQRELDEDQFQKLLLFFLSKYRSLQGCQNFVVYFKEHYVHRTHLWAFCYRFNQDANTNENLENLHRNLKQVHWLGTKIRRVDISVLLLMKILLSMQCERLVQLDIDFLPKKLKESKHHHQTALLINFDVSQDEHFANGFFVVKSANKTHYVHIDLEKECECLLHCTECKLYFNEVACTCIDFSISSIMCKHIHYVAMKFSEVLLLKNRHITTSKQSTLEIVDESSSDNEESVPNIEHSLIKRKDILVSKQKQIMEEVGKLVYSCKNLEELRTVAQFVKPMGAALADLRATKKHTISSTSGAQGRTKNRESKKVSQQKSFRDLLKGC